MINIDALEKHDRLFIVYHLIICICNRLSYIKQYEKKEYFSRTMRVEIKIYQVNLSEEECSSKISYQNTEFRLII